MLQNYRAVLLLDSEARNAPTPNLLLLCHDLLPKILPFEKHFPTSLPWNLVPQDAQFFFFFKVSVVKQIWQTHESWRVTEN